MFVVLFPNVHQIVKYFLFLYNVHQMAKSPTFISFAFF